VPTSTLQDVVRGLVAVPITGPSGQIVGTICVFDLKPLVLSDLDVDALKALGRSVTFGDQVHAGAVPAQPPIPPLHTPPPSETPEREAEARQPANAPKQMAPGPASEEPGPLLDRLNGEFAGARELARARREQRQVSVVLFSISAPEPGRQSFVGSIQAGAMVGDTLVKAIRQSDLPIRWSADEVLLVLPGLALDDARRVAERVRAALQAGTGHRAAVSAGVAELLASETFGTLVSRARERVQLALEHGHNRVA
jgi:hypothetical protein